MCGVIPLPDVLVIEDDSQAAVEIMAALNDHGLAVDSASDGPEALLRVTAKTYDAIVLDRILPGRLDGLGLLATLRTAGIEAPVLILSGLSGVDERVRGLRAGGDDYLTKPFDVLELTARLDALLRRQSSASQRETMRVGALEMHLLRHTVTHAGKPIELRAREFRLLECLTRHAGQVVTRTMLFDEVWNHHHIEPTRVIDVHIGKLRHKLDPEGTGPVIETVRGAGYILHAPD